MFWIGLLLMITGMLGIAEMMELDAEDRQGPNPGAKHAQYSSLTLLSTGVVVVGCVLTVLGSLRHRSPRQSSPSEE
jgi:hypothetical protein